MKLNRKDYNILEENFPHLVDEMKNRVRKFSDSKMVFRRQAIANIPWLRFIDPEIVKQVLEKVEIQRYSKGGIILKKGHKSDCVYIVMEGRVDILISEGLNGEERRLFDWLNRGSCFGVFTFLDPNSIRMVTFEASSECVIATLSKQKLMVLEQKFYQIRDVLMKVRVSLLEGTANEFDFYRYLPKREKELSQNIRNQIKKKFRAVFKLFIKRVKSNSSKEIETLNTIQDMITQRKFKIYELNDFKIDADITSDDQDLIKNTLIPIADIIKTRTENFQSFQKNNPKLFIDYFRKKAMKSGANICQQVPGMRRNEFMHQKMMEMNSMKNKEMIGKFSQSKEIAEAKNKLAEAHEIPEEWENRVEKVIFCSMNILDSLFFL